MYSRFQHETKKVTHLEKLLADHRQREFELQSCTSQRAPSESMSRADAQERLIQKMDAEVHFFSCFNPSIIRFHLFSRLRRCAQKIHGCSRIQVVNVMILHLYL